MREHGRALFLPSPLVREVTSYPLPLWERVASASDSKREPGEGENA